MYILLDKDDSDKKLLSETGNELLRYAIIELCLNYCIIQVLHHLTFDLISHLADEIGYKALRHVQREFDLAKYLAK